MAIEVQGLLHAINQQFVDGFVQQACFTFDTAGSDSAAVSNKTIAAHPTGVILPAHAIIIGGFFDVNTKFTSADTNTGEIAIHVQAANDIQTAAAVSGAPYSTIGRKAIVPKASTPESTSVKTSAAKEITVTVTVAALTAGKLTGYLWWVPGIASA